MQGPGCRRGHSAYCVSSGACCGLCHGRGATAGPLAKQQLCTRGCYRAHVGRVSSVCFTSGSVKVLSCGDDGQLVATTVDGSLMEAFAGALLHLVDSSGGGGGSSSSGSGAGRSSSTAVGKGGSRQRAGQDAGTTSTGPDGLSLLRWHLEQGILQVNLLHCCGGFAHLQPLARCCARGSALQLWAGPSI
jgi:hypothetical protein